MEIMAAKRRKNVTKTCQKRVTSLKKIKPYKRWNTRNCPNSNT